MDAARALAQRAPPAAAFAPRARQQRCAASQRNTAGGALSVYAAAAEDGPRTRLFVARRFGIDVDESGLPAGRRLRDYVRLPAERYNVLDSRAVTRVGEDSFRVSTGLQKLVMFEAEPVGYIQIRVLPEGVEQRLTRAELVSPKENKGVDEINAVLQNVQLTNRVTSEPSPDGGKQLVCQLVLSGTFTRGVLARVPEARLNGLMSWALGVAMPWFLTKLAQDYRLWATDKPRSASLATGEMAGLARTIASGGGSMPPGVRELPVEGKDALAAAVSPTAPTAEEVAVPEAPPPAARGFGGKAAAQKK